MKKYINPELQIVKIETHKMLAESIRISSEAVDASTATGRSFDFEDDNEE